LLEFPLSHPVCHGFMADPEENTVQSSPDQ
jgi:hypothetical protein